MKLLRIICFSILLILISKSIYCQEQIDQNASLKWVIDTTDNFEIKYNRYKSIQSYTDTLVLYSDEDLTNVWRDIQLVTYYYQGNSLEIISFRDGRRGTYFFFFEDSDIKKIRIGFPGMNKITNYYYSKAENETTRIYPQKLDKGIQFKCKVCLLNIGLAFKKNFWVYYGALLESLN